MLAGHEKSPIRPLASDGAADRSRQDRISGARRNRQPARGPPPAQTSDARTAPSSARSNRASIPSRTCGGNETEPAPAGPSCRLDNGEPIADGDAVNPSAARALAPTVTLELAALANGEALVLGGTPWLWADPKAQHVLDGLFIDEAAQSPLANAVAVSRAANSLVLLGDPQQLPQPTQGSYPPSAEVSALGHFLGADSGKNPEESCGASVLLRFSLEPAQHAAPGNLSVERSDNHAG